MTNTSQALPTQKRRLLAGSETLYTIGDMARLYGVTLRALRFYEDRGLISPYRQGSARYYDAAARARLETILKGKHMGFTLSEISAMLPRQPETGEADQLALEENQVVAQLERLERKRAEMDAAIQELQQTRDRLAIALRGEQGANRDAAREGAAA
jgi:DNA-binding transcriptional MerR regulator